MEIKLLNYTKDGISLIANAVRVSSPEFDKVNDEDIIRRLVKHDYGSALEHISFTFELKDISVALSRDLLEHRIASHTAKSTRYVSESKENFKYYLPPDLCYHSIKTKDKLLAKYIEHMNKTYDLYKEIELVVNRESARYVLPMALQCTYIWTVNVRSLINFLRLRQCRCASPEAQELARQIKKLVVEVYPDIFINVGCRATIYELGICPEPNARSCHAYPTKKDMLKKFANAPIKKVTERMLDK